MSADFEDETDLISEDLAEDLLEELPSLLALKSFADQAAEVDWFARVGNALDAATAAEANAFLTAMGLPHINLSLVTELDEVTDLAEAIAAEEETNSSEAQYEETLYLSAIEEIDEQGLRILLAHIQEQAVEAIRTAALDTLSLWEDDEPDETLVNLAVGSAIRALQQQALVIAGHKDDEPHPFTLKYRLFEKGRWPIGILGSTMNLF